MGSASKMTMATTTQIVILQGILGCLGGGQALDRGQYGRHQDYHIEDDGQESYNLKRQDSYKDLYKDTIQGRRQDPYNFKTQGPFQNRARETHENRRQDNYQYRGQETFQEKTQNNYKNRGQDRYKDVRQDRQVDSIEIIAGDYDGYDYDLEYSQANNGAQQATNTHGNKVGDDKRFGFGVGVSQFGQNVVSGSANTQKDHENKFGFGVGISQFLQNVVPKGSNDPQNDKRIGSHFGQNVVPGITNNGDAVQDALNTLGFGSGGANILSVTNTDDADVNSTDKRFNAGVSAFNQNLVPQGTPDKDAEEDDSHLTPWEKLQKKRIEEVVKKVNATFEPVKHYFNFTYLTGHEDGDETYHVGTLGKQFGEFILNLPDLLPKDRLSGIWKFLFDNEEQILQTKLKTNIANGETLYTNKNRDGGFVFELIESNEWWHETMTFCTKAKTERFSPKSLACSLIIDFGLTILIELLFFKDLVICSGLMYLTGDTTLCLALYVSKLAYPDWYSQNTPWMANNVHLG